jgi:ribosomal-protein-alanine N-acetyltransferase
MAPTLKTKRLILRPLSISDRDSMVDIIMSDRDVMYWLPRSDEASTKRGQREVASVYIKNFTGPWNEHGFGIFAVCIRDVELGPAETFIGYCGFIPEQIEGAGPELAYAIGKSMWCKGLVTEALIACLDWIFIKPKISRVYAVTDKENKSSRRVMEKVGMRHEKDVDLYNSEAKGYGLLPFYSIEREDYLRKRKTAVGSPCFL